MNNQINENTAAKKITKQGENMTIEIPKDKWTEFLNDFSKRRFGWETKVEVLDKSVGDQMLSEGLVLNGVTHEEKSGKCEIEISLGENVDQHQSHTISKPSKLAYLSENKTQYGVLEIEDESGTKTLISLIEPMPVYFGYASYSVSTS
jgi:Family of unknown function (DUF5335)